MTSNECYFVACVHKHSSKRMNKKKTRGIWQTKTHVNWLFNPQFMAREMYSCVTTNKNDIYTHEKKGTNKIRRKICSHKSRSSDCVTSIWFDNNQLFYILWNLMYIVHHNGCKFNWIANHFKVKMMMMMIWIDGC